MKRLTTILRSKPVFLHNWSKQTDVFNSFRITANSRIKILFASYNDEDYSGDAFVLFSENKELYEVSGSHCSCYGLEDQWHPSKVSLEELEHRLTEGTFGTQKYSGNQFKDELKLFLGIK